MLSLSAEIFLSCFSHSYFCSPFQIFYLVFSKGIFSLGSFLNFYFLFLRIIFTWSSLSPHFYPFGILVPFIGIGKGAKPSGPGGVPRGLNRCGPAILSGATGMATGHFVSLVADFLLFPEIRICRWVKCCRRPLVLPTLCRTFRPIQKKNSAAKAKKKSVPQ